MSVVMRLKTYLLKEGLATETSAEADAPTNAACTDEEHEAMRSKTIRFF